MDNTNSSRKNWHTPKELSAGFNSLGKQLNRLMILEHAWKDTVGSKCKFWVLKSVKGGTLYVEANLSVAKTELIAKRSGLIKELNKYFDTAWIKKIEVQ